MKPIDNLIRSHRWRLRRANSNHIPDGTSTDRTLLYVHGGGYVACSARTHRSFSSAFAQQGFRVFVPDYRLAPEHPFPAGLMDVIAVY
ncbi:MAG TPA: alpha/beta hydrolase, partial [Pyrinomonadaceae bacterium]|nr:alpha/beta hydrolase [Pyrinomonadaceae bacterium]